ncbi:hypothetical protein Tco_0918406, partial [Tanacetum coccineum]
DPMDINKMTDTLEPEETGVGGLQLPGKDRVVFRPSERKSLLDPMDINKMMDTLDPEETGLADCSCRGKIESSWPSERITIRISRSSDHRRSRRHSPEYDRREGRAVSRRYTDDKDYRDHSEPSPRQGRDNKDYDIKRSKYKVQGELLV